MASPPFSLAGVDRHKRGTGERMVKIFGTSLCALDAPAVKSPRGSCRVDSLSINRIPSPGRGATMTESAIQPSVQPDATLKSTPETILWGYIAANLPPVLTIKSGQTVEIETLSHQGLTTNKDPEKFFAGYGISGNEVLVDAKNVYSQAKRPKGAS